MKLEKLALVAQVISGAAIVISLAILIVELRGNTAAVEAQTIESHVASERRRRERLFLNEGGIADLVLKHIDEENLTPSESWRLDRYYGDILDSAEWQFQEVEAGRLPASMLTDSFWQSMWQSQPKLRERYDRTADDRSPQFREYWEMSVIGK